MKYSNNTAIRLIPKNTPIFVKVSEDDNHYEMRFYKFTEVFSGTHFVGHKKGEIEDTYIGYKSFIENLY